MFREVWININKAIAELMGLDYYSEEEPEDYEDFP